MIGMSIFALACVDTKYGRLAEREGCEPLVINYRAEFS